MPHKTQLRCEMVMAVRALPHNHSYIMQYCLCVQADNSIASNVAVVVYCNSSCPVPGSQQAAAAQPRCSLSGGDPQSSVCAADVPQAVPQASTAADSNLLLLNSACGGEASDSHMTHSAAYACTVSTPTPTQAPCQNCSAQAPANMPRQS